MNIRVICDSSYLSIGKTTFIILASTETERMPSLSQRGGYVKYHKVNTVDDGFVDAQFRKPPPKPPVKSILLAVFLFTLGSLLLIIGSLLFTGYIDVQVGYVVCIMFCKEDCFHTKLKTSFSILHSMAFFFSTRPLMFKGKYPWALHQTSYQNLHQSSFFTTSTI